MGIVTRAELLRVPGIGPKSADAIVAAWRQATFTELAHLHKVGVRDVGRTSPYILLIWRASVQQLALLGG